MATQRCHLLYRQAVYASKESAQLEGEIRLLKEKEAMRECTFQPQLLPHQPRRQPSARAPQPRNFDLAVKRMRAARQQKEELHEARWHIPAGENYERLRRLGQQPFSCYYRDRPATSTRRGPPLCYIDVVVGHGRTGRIGVHEGDNLRAKAASFAKTFQLDRDAALRLEDMLHEAYEERLRTLDLEARFDAAAGELSSSSVGGCSSSGWPPQQHWRRRTSSVEQYTEGGWASSDGYYSDGGGSPSAAAAAAATDGGTVTGDGGGTFAGPGPGQGSRSGSEGGGAAAAVSSGGEEPARRRQRQRPPLRSGTGGCGLRGSGGYDEAGAEAVT